MVGVVVGVVVVGVILIDWVFGLDYCSLYSLELLDWITALFILQSYIEIAKVESLVDSW